MSKDDSDLATTSKKILRPIVGAISTLVREPGRHLRLHRCIDESNTPTDCDVILYQSAYQQIMKHLEADTTREHGGLLLGYICRSGSGSPPAISIMTSLPAPHTSGTRTSLTFTEETWVSFQKDIDELERRNVNLQRLGWYHSHPGIAVFLSHWDLDVCTNFHSRHHVALVVDPIKCRGAFFPRGENGYRPHEPRGFWEYPDVEPDSLVRWTNTYEVRREWMIPAYEVFPVEQLEEVDEIEDTQDSDQPEKNEEFDPMGDASVVEVETQDLEIEVQTPESEPEHLPSDVNNDVSETNETVLISASESIPELERSSGSDGSAKSNSKLQAPRPMAWVFDRLFGVDKS